MLAKFLILGVECCVFLFAWYCKYSPYVWTIPTSTVPSRCSPARILTPSPSRSRTAWTLPPLPSSCPMASTCRGEMVWWGELGGWCYIWGRKATIKMMGICFGETVWKPLYTFFSALIPYFMEFGMWDVDWVLSQFRWFSVRRSGCSHDRAEGRKGGRFSPGFFQYSWANSCGRKLLRLEGNHPVCKNGILLVTWFRQILLSSPFRWHLMALREPCWGNIGPALLSVSKAWIYPKSTLYWSITFPINLCHHLRDPLPPFQVHPPGTSALPRLGALPLHREGVGREGRGQLLQARLHLGWRVQRAILPYRWVEYDGIWRVG